MSALETFRKRRGWTQQELANAVGLRSKGYISAIESGREICSLRLALKLERLSDGELKAIDLRPSDKELMAAGPAEARP